MPKIELPDCLYLVKEYGGEWEDKYERTYGGFFSEKKARQAADLLGERSKMYDELTTKLYKLGIMDEYGGGDDTPQYSIECEHVCDAYDYLGDFSYGWFDAEKTPPEKNGWYLGMVFLTEGVDGEPETAFIPVECFIDKRAGYYSWTDKDCDEADVVAWTYLPESEEVKYART